MSRRVLAGVVALLLGGAVAHAHHAIGGVYDSQRQVRIEGVVTAFHFVSPHPFVEVAVSASANQEDWRLEMDNRSELSAAGMDADSLRAGDRVQVSGSAARDGSRKLYIRR